MHVKQTKKQDFLFATILISSPLKEEKKNQERTNLS